MKKTALLEVQDLSVRFHTARGDLTAVDSVSFAVAPGQTLGVVGESGSGKSVTNLALMGLLADNAQVSATAVRFEGKDISSLSYNERRKVCGKKISMIFQDPMNSLNPCFTVGFQLKEAIRTHQKIDGGELERQCVELLEKVGIPDPRERMSAFPHQLSGGMSQRVMIAMAIACQPSLLIADEPTTALDVTIQAQILDLLKELKKDIGMSMILITHDIGLVAEQADRIMVMYAGQVVEIGEADEVIHQPMHPYTKGLLDSMPGFHMETEFRTPLPTIPGVVPDLVHRAPGCQLYGRCPIQESRCQRQTPPLIERQGRFCKCFKPMTEAQP